MAERQFRQNRRAAASNSIEARARLADFRNTYNRRVAGQIRAMITDNNRLVENLDQEIRAEERGLA